MAYLSTVSSSSNNTNKLSPQERVSASDFKSDVQIIQINLVLKNPLEIIHFVHLGSNNTNKLSPQEQGFAKVVPVPGSNNTNKLSPQERLGQIQATNTVQIIQINLVLKNRGDAVTQFNDVQIIQINLVLKNNTLYQIHLLLFK